MSDGTSSQPAAVFLDALGTLVSLAPPWSPLVTLLRERHGVVVAPDDARRAMLAEMDYYRRNCVRAADVTSLAALRVQCAMIVRERLEPLLDALSDAEIVAALLGALRFTPYDDVPSALARWREAGCALIVASNWDISLHDVLESTGLRPLLDGVVCSAQVGASKPSPAIFAAALALAGVSADRAVHIGDSLEEDVAGARAAGIEPILLNRGGEAIETEGDLRVIATLSEC